MKFHLDNPATGGPALNVAGAAMSAMAGSETTCSLYRLSRTKHGEATARLVAECFHPRKGPLLVRRQPIRAQSLLRETGEVVRECERGSKSLPRSCEAIDKAHAQRLLPRDATTCEN